MSDHTSPAHAQGSDAASLARRLASIREARMRHGLVADYLVAAPPERAVATLQDLVRGAVDCGNAGYTRVLASLTSVLDSADGRLPYAKRAALYAAAKRADRMAVARLFFDVSPVHDRDERGAARDDAIAHALAHTPGTRNAGNAGRTGARQRSRVRSRDRPLTLGERKSLARSHRRDLLTALARDPDVEVIRILLGNPHLTEADVLTIAARRPGSPDVLALLASDARWSIRYRVKRALARNPYTPIHVGIRLLTTLRATDLRTIAADAKLAPAVREQARAILAGA